ncbi:MAG TPA: DNA topoisomerase 3 [Symbiobacteriaceae bacterium]|jgi:DNA topoisomerase-3
MVAAKKPLIIAEKPSAARAIAEALGGFARKEGYLESSEYNLSWAIGHLVELMGPEEYDPRWKRWTLESLPIMPNAFGLKVVSRTKSQFDVLVRLARSASDLINACDAAREGELIFRYICEAGGIRLPARRLWVSSLTREAIRKAFADLKPEAEYDRLYQSALCRAHGDWLVGMNATRAYTVKWGELLSVGRVQTPTLALMVRREREIAAFVPEQYWEVVATFTADRSRSYKGKWFGKDGDRLKSAADAEAVAARVKGQPGRVESVEEKPVAEKPPQLYDLTTLQREANRKFGLTAAATLKTAQSLYEAKLITYPRTDSRYLTHDQVGGLPGVVKAVGTLPEFQGLAAGADLGLVSRSNFRVINDSKVSDHHAIIPTTEVSSGLSAVEAKIYGLIVRRFLAQFYPEAKFLETEIITRAGMLPDRFRSKGRRVVEPGWRVVEPEPARKKDDPEAEADVRLPSLAPEEPAATKTVDALEKATQPPKRYTEASLLSAMEFAGRDMDDEALKEAMKGRGLGTPATRASIIERLKEVGYIELAKKALTPTPKGHKLVELAEAAGSQVLLSAELTGEWERRIADIQAGAGRPDVFMADIRRMAAQVVEQAKAASGGGPGTGAGAVARGGAGAPKAGAGVNGGAATSPDAALPAYAGKCPRCGRAVVRGKKDWVCANSDCAVRIPTWLCGKVVDGPLASLLLTKGRTSLITGFKSPRTGKTFSAFLLLKEGKVEFEFPADKPKKASGYRSSPGKGATAADDHTAAAKTGPRKTGTGTDRKSATGTGSRGVGRGSARTPQPAGTGPQPD